MNVIVGNLNNSKFLNLDVDIIKTINGEFSAEEIVQSFSNFFFNRMFLDITSIQDYADIHNLKKLSMGLDVSKIILLLSNDTVVNSDMYISNLISLGFYNFARNENDLKYLYNNPNSYKDVAHLQTMNPIGPEISAVSDIVADEDIKIIGFKNFTSHAGATSLIYMLKKQLEKNYYVIGIEVNKRDFLFYRDMDMISCDAKDLSKNITKFKDANVILIDLNDLDMATAESICSDIIYLMESSTLMINKAVMLDNECFKKLSNRKVILNKSLLDTKDINRLQFESGLKFFSVFPPMNDRKNNSEYLLPMLEKIGLYKKN